MFTITDINEFRREARVKSRVHAIANARQAAELLESDRVASIEVPQLRVAKEAAWVAFQKATEEMVAATERMNKAHNKWLDIDLKLYAASAAEKTR